MEGTSGSACRTRLLAPLGPDRLGRLRPGLGFADLLPAALIEAPDEPIAHL